MQPTKAAKSYLTDWKNLLAHTIVGILLVVIVFIIPVHIFLRLAIFCVVIVFNMVRMRYEKNRSSLDETSEESSIDER